MADDDLSFFEGCYVYTVTISAEALRHPEVAQHHDEMLREKVKSDAETNDCTINGDIKRLPDVAYRFEYDNGDEPGFVVCPLEEAEFVQTSVEVWVTRG